MQDELQDDDARARRHRPQRGRACAKALEEIEELKERAPRRRAPGNREYNPGWHTALRPAQPARDLREAIDARGAERKESRGGHFREDFPDKDAEFGKFNVVLKKGADGWRREATRAAAGDDPADARRDLKQVVEENK